jgi:hypothetical protein
MNEIDIQETKDLLEEYDKEILHLRKVLVENNIDINKIAYVSDIPSKAYSARYKKGKLFGITIFTLLAWDKKDYTDTLEK